MQMDHKLRVAKPRDHKVEKKSLQEKPIDLERKAMAIRSVSHLEVESLDVESKKKIKDLSKTKCN
jgi:hypothetical protein